VGAARRNRARRYAAAGAGRLTRPRLVTGARLQYDEVRQEHVLLVPEGVVRLNPTAAAVLELCDGERSVDEIVDTLSARYEGDLRDDVQGLVDGMTQRGLVVDAAA
jgi:pyrroloquinoline quinone biosynthesis protein D